MTNDFYLLLSALIGALVTITTIIVKGCIMSKCKKVKCGCIEIDRDINNAPSNTSNLGSITDIKLDMPESPNKK